MRKILKLGKNVRILKVMNDDNNDFSVKSLAAAGKFKNRRYNNKKENTTKQTMGAFLSWFGGSQALDRCLIYVSPILPSCGIF